MSPDPLPLKCATSFGVSPYLSSQMVDVLKRMEAGRSFSPRIRFNKVLFPELGSPSKYRQVKIRREKEKKRSEWVDSTTVTSNKRIYYPGRLHHKSRTKHHLLSSSYSFSYKTIPHAVRHHIAFTQRSVRGWPYYVLHSKDRILLEELSINSLSWSRPADSHFLLFS